jgi:ketosteroid isomerase-like protein
VILRSRMFLETLPAVYEAMGRQDWKRVFHDVHPEFELRTPDRFLGTQIHRGPEEVALAFQDFFEPFEEVLVEPQEFFDHGDRIAVFFHQRARPRGSSAVVELRAGHLWTLRDGKAVRLEIFPQREKALEAAALRG